MPLPTLDLDYVRLTYRSDLHTLFMRWTRTVSSAEHRHGYEQGLLMAQPLGAAHWLIDLRIRGLATDPADFDWLLTDFLPRLDQALPTAMVRLAYLISPYHQVTIQERLRQTGQHDAVRFFIEEATAQHWLDTGE